MLSGYAFLEVSIRRGNVIDEISQIASLMAMVLNWICELWNCFTSVSHQRLVLPRWVHEVTFLRLWDSTTASHLWSVCLDRFMRQMFLCFVNTFFPCNHGLPLWWKRNSEFRRKYYWNFSAEYLNSTCRQILRQQQIHFSHHSPSWHLLHLIPFRTTFSGLLRSLNTCLYYSATILLSRVTSKVLRRN